MSNRAYADTYKVSPTFKEGDWIEIRVFDDYNYSHFSIDIVPDNIEDIFRLVLENLEETYDENIGGVIDNMQRNKRGISINNELLSWEKVKWIIEEYE